jgi:hypothetical protein
MRLGGVEPRAASLNGLEAAVEAFPRATHFYMLSGDCAAVKSAEYAHAFLDETDADYIESFDFFASDWIKTGLKRERLVYRHCLQRTHAETAVLRDDERCSGGWGSSARCPPISR